MAGKQKNVSIDSMFKQFMKNADIPSQKDVDKIFTRLERIEKLLQLIHRKQSRPRSLGRPVGGRGPMTASDTVLNVIRGHKEGVRFPEIHDRTGFDEKKIRNIVFRLDKLGKIERIARGVYIARD